MCGITGSVGKSKHPLLSYNLNTNLLRETKRRGKHATGFYAIDLARKPIWHKAPIAADEYVKQDAWKQLINGNIALIGHARFTTNGVASVNTNNHPHLTQCGRMALVHNGIVYRYDEVKDDYKDLLETECDSEIIIRIIAKEKDPLTGIKKAYELLGGGGDFACELIHLNPDTDKITFYFFRDDGRPGKMIDARETLGQLIFCSETNIWQDAVLKSGMPRSVRQLAVHDIPEYKILAIDADNLTVSETDVEKPKFKRRYFSSRNKSNSSGYSAYGYEYDDYYYKSHYGQRASNAKQKTSTYHESDVYNSSVLGEGWIETVNPDTGLPRFVYDPDETKDQNVCDSKVKVEETSDEDQEFTDILRKCIDDPNYRYPGWQDEALSYGLITEQEWETFSDEASEDALDHITGDHFDFYRASDEQMIERVCKRNMEEDEYSDYGI